MGLQWYVLDVNPVILKEECFMLSTPFPSVQIPSLVPLKAGEGIYKADIIGYIEEPL